MVNKRIFVPGSDRHLRRGEPEIEERPEGNGVMAVVMLTAALAAAALGFSSVQRPEVAITEAR
ncbi:MAG: hypothetical protein H6712_09380 [Myxococcales bacterium]|nr:hypothetical protein [Myxococcales bacterium]